MLQTNDFWQIYFYCWKKSGSSFLFFCDFEVMSFYFEEKSLIWSVK